MTDSGRLYTFSGGTNANYPECDSVVSAAGNLTLRSDSWIFPASHGVRGGSTLFQIGGDVTIDSNAGFSADGLGHRGGTNASGYGYGPGGGQNCGNYGAGGGHGGWGGKGNGVAAGGPYDNKTNPVLAGSGGGGATTVKTGGNGGGVVRLEVTNGTVQVNGKITANGANGSTASYCGGGAGGTVNILCKTFTGTNGLITANGGNGQATWASGGSGGGGRVAIYGTPAPDYNRSVKLGAVAGVGGDTGGHGTAGYSGTILASDDGLLPNSWPSGCGGVLVSTSTTVTVPNMFISNTCVQVDQGLSVVVTNALVASSINTWTFVSPIRSYPRQPDGLHLWTNTSLTCNGSMSLSNVYVYLYGGTNTSPAGTNLTTLVVGGDLALHNRTRFFTYSGGTNVAFPDCDSAVVVTGTLALATNAWIYPASDATWGGGTLFQVGDLTIASNAGFNADGLGWRGWWTNSPYTYIARGPGAGWYGGGVVGYGGGSYGGLGGGETLGTYGDSNAPVQPGSSGACYLSYKSPGGGLVRIEASGTVSVDGTISANGVSESIPGAAGSGGGIYVRCRRFFGGPSASVSAKGGDAVPAGLGRSGGGGRIAIWWSSATNYAGAVSAAGGTVNSPVGGPGTIVWKYFGVPGTVFMLR